MQSVRASMLIPRGFLADDAVKDLSGTLIRVRPVATTSQCPACGAVSGRRDFFRRRKPLTLRPFHENRRKSPQERTLHASLLIQTLPFARSPPK